MKFLNYLLVSIEVILIHEAFGAESDPCTVPGLVEHGTLTKLKNCVFLINKWKKGTLNIEVKRYNVHSNNERIYYCCPARKSVRACNDFGRKQGFEISSRIIGGTFVDVEEFPFFAALGYVNKAKQLFFDCGGALISENFVLTAAHCKKGTQIPVIVRLGRVSN